MATATLTLANPTEGSPWTVTISGTSVLAANAVNNDSGYNSAIVSCTSPNLGSVFTFSSTTNTNSFATYGGVYATWRDLNAVNALSNSQYPTQGFSLDVWSSALVTSINNNNTWTTVSTNLGSPPSNQYSLSSDKWSLIYGYSNLYAPIYSKGGTLTITFA